MTDSERLAHLEARLMVYECISQAQQALLLLTIDKVYGNQQAYHAAMMKTVKDQVQERALKHPELGKFLDETVKELLQQ